MTELPGPSNAQIARLFDTVAADYDQSGVPFFQPIADGLVRLVAPVPGDNVLDIGCGRGAVTVRLAKAVLPGGRVSAVDISAEMVRHTRELLAEVAASADVTVMDACEPDLPEATYDVVTSSLVLFFLPDPVEVARRWLRLLAPGGRLGIATFGAQDPVWDAVDALFGPYLPANLRDPRTLDSEGPFASDEGMEDLLRAAGGGSVHTEHLDLRVRFGDVATWQAFSMSTGQRAMWAGVPDSERPHLIAQAAARLETARDADGDIVVDQQVRYTVARV